MTHFRNDKFLEVTSFAKWAIFYLRSDIFFEMTHYRSDRFQSRNHRFCVVTFFLTVTRFGTDQFPSDIFSKWLVFRNNPFSEWSSSKWHIFRNGSLFEATRFPNRDVFWKWSISKWTIFRSEPFFESIIPFLYWASFQSSAQFSAVLKK